MHKKRENNLRCFLLRAENETRTRDPNLGKVMLYQLSYFRKISKLNGAENETRTRDPNLGKVMLYQLSYFRNVVPRTGLEPACLSTHAPETCASTIPPPGHSV